MGLILANPPRDAAIASRARTPWDAPAPLRLWHLASLDAPTVAVTWAWAFAWAAHAALPAWILLLLGLTVWAIYIADRLLDIWPKHRTCPGHPLQERHYFHWRNRRILMPLAAVAATVALWLVGSRLSGTAIGKDSFVAVATLAYFSGVHTRSDKSRSAARFLKRILSRELIVGVIFSSGCVLPLISVGRLRHLHVLILLAVIGAWLCFAMLAWLNVHAIGRWESPHVTGKRLRVPALVLAGVSIALSVSCAGVAPRIAALLAAAAASALLLGLLDRARMRFAPLALRIAADVALLTPALLALASLRAL